jgi:NodT family efflux transporter outer membrane factor (OMF) lipoprotein
MFIDHRPTATVHPRRLLALFLLVGGLWACQPFAPPRRPDPAESLPRLYGLYEPGTEGPARWWETFGDPELNALVEEGLAGNLSLAQAWARLAQARAQSAQAAADLFPEVDGAAGAQITRQDDGDRTWDTQEFSLGLLSRYEADLWGRLRASRQAARLEADATREDLDAAAMSLAAETTLQWAEIISQRMQLRLLEEQAAINRTYLDLVLLRFRKALASSLDVYQQRQLLEQVKAEIPLVEAREQRARHALALLLGQAPRTALLISREELPLPAGLPAMGLPVDLLAARPDVRAAGLRLQAADWQLAAARANRLPRLSLSAQAAADSDRVADLFDEWLTNLAANLTAPLLDGGRRAAEVVRTRALGDERLAGYRETVLAAVGEVEDALVTEDRQRAHIAGLLREIETGRLALREARERYRKGLNDYLPVLTQLLAVQRRERDLIQQQAALVAARVELHRALGGGWTGALVPPDATADRLGKP